MWWNFPLEIGLKQVYADIFGGNIDFAVSFGLEAPMSVEIMMVGK